MIMMVFSHHFMSKLTELQLLLRFVDDYLFITTDVQEARTFLDVMNKGESPQPSATGASPTNLRLIKDTPNMAASLHARRP